MNSKKSPLNLSKLFNVFIILIILEGFLSLLFLFRIPSDLDNSFIGKYSFMRIEIGIAVFIANAFFVILLIHSHKSKKIFNPISRFLGLLKSNEIIRLLTKAFLINILVISFAILLLFIFPPIQRIAPFINIQDDSIFWVIKERAGFLIGWIFLIALKFLLLVFFFTRNLKQTAALPSRLMIVSWTVEFFIVLSFLLGSIALRTFAWGLLKEVGLKNLILSTWFTIWSILSNHKDRARKIFMPFAAISIWLCVFLISLQFVQWFVIWNTPSLNHFNIFASAMLQGKLYVINPPNTYDLTFFNGHWYVPQPPFPAFLMMPFIAILGVDSFNTTTFSLALAAATAVVLFLILQKLTKLNWINLSFQNSIWLVALFSFGTTYWWLSLDSKVWFFAQIVTVLFCALAILASLYRAMPFISGGFLAAAILSRPNVFVLWAALLGITIQLGYKKMNLKHIIQWCIFSAIPIILGVFLLLYLNYLKFGNLLDFGYATINGWDELIQKAQTYGLFSPHYISENIKVMFLDLPKLEEQCGYYLQGRTGMSIFATTPALIYLFRKMKLSWWLAGCWSSIIFSIILLSMYSNNGALQYGYRYALDFIIPAVMIIAYHAGERVSPTLRILILTSIAINYYGTISWFYGPC